MTADLGVVCMTLLGSAFCLGRARTAFLIGALACDGDLFACSMRTSWGYVHNTKFAAEEHQKAFELASPKKPSTAGGHVGGHDNSSSSLCSRYISSIELASGKGKQH